MLSLSNEQLRRSSPLRYEDVIAEVKYTNMSHTWFAWYNLCDTAFIGINRANFLVATEAMQKLHSLIDVLSNAVGNNKYWQVKQDVIKVSHVIQKGERDLALYWLGQLRCIIAEVQENFPKIPEGPKRKLFNELLQDIVGPKPADEPAA